MEYFNLNNGTKIPAMGIGTFLLKPAEAEESVIAALRNGYEMIDTANAYMNERAVGRGIKASGMAREKVYLVTKLWPSTYAKADQAIDDTLKRLDADYVDLLYLHQPIGDYVGAYQAMERAVKSGKVRTLGLSNFPVHKIQQVLDACEIKPAFLQVEAHPYFPQTSLKEFLKDTDIRIMAWYPLGHGDKSLLNEPVFAKLSEKYGKSPAQIILRWHTLMGHQVIPGSRSEAHIRENINIFDFSLTDEEMAEIAKLDKNIAYYRQTEEALQGYLAFAPNFDAQE